MINLEWVDYELPTAEWYGRIGYSLIQTIEEVGYFFMLGNGRDYVLLSFYNAKGLVLTEKRFPPNTSIDKIKEYANVFINRFNRVLSEDPALFG